MNNRFVKPSSLLGGDNTVSVIDVTKNQIVNTLEVIPILKTSFKDNDPLVNVPIDVRFPLITSFVAVNSATNMVYLTNTASNTISAIDGNKDTVVVRLNFDINPPHSGDIVMKEKGCLKSLIRNMIKP